MRDLHAHISGSLGGGDIANIVYLNKLYMSGREEINAITNRLASHLQTLLQMDMPPRPTPLTSYIPAARTARTGLRKRWQGFP